MTITSPTSPTSPPTVSPNAAAASASRDAARVPPAASTSVDREEAVEAPRRKVQLSRLIFVWFAVALAALVLVLYAVEPLFQQNTQSQLMDQYVMAIDKATNETSGLGGVSVPTKAPELGAPVAILEIAGIRLQQVVVEGVAPSQTQAGPGHVPGTAAPGQPGNAAIAGRRGMFGGPFGQLEQLVPEDLILITTTQGQVVYRVSTVEKKQIVPEPDPDDASSSAGTTTATTSLPVPGTEGDVAVEAGPQMVTIDQLYAPTDTDQLTLVTSASAWPNNSSLATVVVAKLEGRPYEPTPQAGRTDNQSGNASQGGSWPGVLLAIQAFVLSAVGAVFLYRRSSTPIAYLLTTPPLIAFAILAAEQISRLLPAWA